MQFLKFKQFHLQFSRRFPPGSWGSRSLPAASSAVCLCIFADPLPEPDESHRHQRGMLFQKSFHGRQSSFIKSDAVQTVFRSALRLKRLACCFLQFFRPGTGSHWRICISGRTGERPPIPCAAGSASASCRRILGSRANSSSRTFFLSSHAPPSISRSARGTPRRGQSCRLQSRGAP